MHNSYIDRYLPVSPSSALNRTRTRTVDLRTLHKGMAIGEQTTPGKARLD